MAYWVMKRTLGPVLRYFYRIRVEGLVHVPATGAVILASNHLSFSDSIFLPLVLRRRVTFVAKAEYFEDRRTAWLFRALGMIPVRRGGGSASERALVAARDVLAAGGVFAIYPEGTRSPDGCLYKGHTGVARLALQSGAPVVAVAMLGTAEAQPIGQAVPNVFRQITVCFSPPMHFASRAGDDPLALRRVTDEIMFTLRSLSGQRYVDRYCKRAAGRAESLEPGEPARIRTAPVAVGAVGAAVGACAVAAGEAENATAA